MAEDLANAIVDAANRMESKSRTRPLAAIYFRNHPTREHRYFLQRQLVSEQGFAFLLEAHNYAVKNGLVPLRKAEIPFLIDRMPDDGTEPVLCAVYTEPELGEPT